MHRRAFLTLSAAALLSGCVAPLVPGTPNGKLIVLRHADRTTAMLNERGVARAAKLPEALAGIPIDAIYTTPRQRNIDTATPLSRERALPINNLLAFGAAGKILGAHPGQTVVWVGNQENLGLFYAELGLLEKPPVQFGDLHIVTWSSNGRPRVDKRRYGD